MTSTELPLGKLAVPARGDMGHVALTRVFAGVARDLQRCAPLDSDATLDAVLGRVGSAMGACRAYVFEVVDTVFIRNTHEWCAPGIVPMKPELQHVPYHIGAVFWDRFGEHGSIQISDVSTLIANSDLRQVLEEQDIAALIAAPFWRNGEMTGFVGLDYTTGPRSFLPEEDNLMRSLASQIGMLRALTVSARDALRVETELARASARLSATVAALPELLVETNHERHHHRLSSKQPADIRRAPARSYRSTARALSCPRTWPRFVAKPCVKLTCWAGRRRTAIRS